MKTIVSKHVKGEGEMTEEIASCGICGWSGLLYDVRITPDGPICPACSSSIDIPSSPDEDEEQVRIGLLVSEGHTEHCARRQVWGDGDCECGKLLRDPYWWKGA